MDRFADNVGLSTTSLSSSPINKSFNPYSHNFSNNNNNSKDYRCNSLKKKDDVTIGTNISEQSVEKFDPDSIIKVINYFYNLF